MTKRRRSTGDLPEDLVIEILSRVPTVSLARFQSTCKRWNALINDEKFAKKQFANAPKKSLAIILIDHKVYLLSLDHLQKFHNNIVPSAKLKSHLGLYDSYSQAVNIRSVFSCHGLLLFSTTDNRLVVGNPFTGETKWIQPKSSYKESDYYALGYDTKSSRYKILRMDKLESQSEYEIYDLASDSWRLVGVNTDKILRMDKFEDDILSQSEYEIYDLASDSWRLVGVNTDWLIKREQSHGVSVKGNTYWVAFSQSEPCHIPFLLSFDFSTEEFQSMLLPVDVSSYYGFRLSVTREEQQLCMLAFFEFNVFHSHIWVATMNHSTGKLSWTKSLRVLATDEPNKLDVEKSFLADEENKVVLSCTDTGVFKNIINIAGEDRYVKVDLHGAEESHSPLLLSYAPSLVQIQQEVSSSLKEAKRKCY